MMEGTPKGPSQKSGLLDSDVESVSVASLATADSPRLAGENIEHAYAIARSNTEFPPIIVHRSSLRIITTRRS